MKDGQHIFLVPGFFGFANIGDYVYFSHVKRCLAQSCVELGLRVKIHAISTYPTSSIRARTERLLELVALATAHDDFPIHVVGHSCGGLDARLLLAPQASLRTTVDVEKVVRRVASVTTVATPHYGTPVASFFTSLFGQRLLQLLSLGTIYALWFGRLPTSVVFKLGALLAQTDRLLGEPFILVEQLFQRLLADFSPEPRKNIERLIGEIGSDQALLPQLTPEGVDMLNAVATDRPGVRYGSVISYARPPGMISTATVGLSIYGQATHALFYALYRLASRMPDNHVPQLNEGQVDSLLHVYGMIPDKEANDGVVPTLSQVWGEIIHATRADHLDVLGHFKDTNTRPPHLDWLSSGTGFQRQHFLALWRDVARFIAEKPSQMVKPSSRLQHLMHLFSRRR
jgi:triacylglycerol esterase/lipase EstA (alpha/beta hydrolase family)